MLRIKDLLDEIEKVAPLPLQEHYDNAGVQVGDVNQIATGVLLCLDVTERVIDEAIEAGFNLILAHHPLLFKPLKTLTGANYIERCLIKACKHDLVIYAAHTNLDNAVGGLNRQLAVRLGLQNPRILSPQKGRLLKLVTYVPEACAEAVRTALFRAGAGNIGHYDACSFNVHGTGTFRASEQAHPFCGIPGELHHEKEQRIETILPSFSKTSVTQALLSVHPYEEPAFDFYPLENGWQQAGAGVLGELPEATDELLFLQQVKKVFDAESLRHSPPTGKSVRKIAVCGGSGAFLIPEAIAAGAEVLITGEAKYNDFFDVENRILLVVTGHYESEACAKAIFREIISEKFPTFAAQISETKSNPVNYL